MTVFRNVVFIAAIAGLVAGIAMAAMQSFVTVPLVLEAETYEGQAIGGHSHGHAGGEEHDHGAAVAADEAEPWAPADGFERFAYTSLASIVTAIGFGLLLVAVSEFAGGIAGWRQGLFWGLAGFAVFTLAPGLALPPELPGMPAADLGGRQAWWIATVVATAAGLALIAFRGSVLMAALGVVLIVLPHVVGAPQPASHETAVPADLHHQFVVAVSMTNLVFWVLLGGLAGYVRTRLAGGEADASPGVA